ncbi:MAG: glycosyl hydrolase family 2 [Bacteroidaceae bacterium]|nr:glycosyl hydrolase family 2 [Bacteroidaceae bacterium]
MNIKHLSIFALSFISLQSQAQSWPKALPEAKPAARWWWLGSAVDKENLRYNIDLYSKAGIGGLEITPIYGVKNNDANNIPYLSAKWMDMLKETQSIGKNDGVEIDMATGTGWPFGGPEVKLEQAATMAIFQQYNVDGGKNVSLDITIQNKKQEKGAYLSRVMAYQKGKSLNITAQAKDGKLSWNAPAGKWDIVVLYVGKTRQMVKRAAPGGEGYVIDHFNKSSVDSYLARFDKAFKENGTAYPHTFFNDSYEVYGADWTPALLDEFAKRRGYKLEDHFLEFLDEKRNDITCRIVADYRETLGELLLTNFTKTWTDWAHKNGAITRNQAHGSPANLIDVYASVDIPECEGFGLSQFHIKGLREDSLKKQNDSDLSMLKYASSGAHISGKQFTSSETFTWLTEHFRTSLSQCKPDIDLMFVSGVNHVFFHGICYSPKQDEWPGWKFYASVDMSPTNTIWRDAPYFFDYITRCQSFLQWGKPDNDFLVYLPVYDMWNEQSGRLLMFDIHHMKDRAPRFIESVNKIINSGYDVDYISDNFIRSLQYKNQSLVTKGGAAYKAIVIPAVHLMPTDILQKLVNLAKQGATVVFLDNYPTDVPGYGNLEKRRAAFKKIKAMLPDVSEGENRFGKGRIIIGSDYPKTLKLCNIAPEEMRTVNGLHCIRRSNATGSHYFISSLQKNGVDDWVTLGKKAAEACLFNPMTGESGKAQVREKDGKTQVYLQLHSGESVILQTFDKPSSVSLTNWNYQTDGAVSISLDHGWKLSFAESVPSIAGTFDIDEPKSWTELDNADAKTNMGTGKYSISFEMPEIKADDWVLDLGDVRESARVKVNGNDAGCAWAVPYRLNVGKYLKSGSNTIEVEVTNLPANRIAQLDREGKEWRKFNEINVVDLKYSRKKYDYWQPVPSGLNGTVKLIPVRKK